MRRHPPARTVVLLVLAASTPVQLSCMERALAHTELSSSSPASGARLPAAPPVVRLTFSAELNPAVLTVVVTGPDGRGLAAGPPSLGGAEVRQPLVEALAPGAHQVAYRVVSTDGHPVAGTLAFTVLAPPLSAPDLTLSTPPATAASAATVPARVAAAVTVPVAVSAVAVSAVALDREVTDQSSWVLSFLLAGALALVVAGLLGTRRLSRRRDQH